MMVHKGERREGNVVSWDDDSEERRIGKESGDAMCNFNFTIVFTRSPNSEREMLREGAVGVGTVFKNLLGNLED